MSDELKSKCPWCKDNQALKKHRCPYQADVNNDDSKYCNCCDNCTQNCADEV